MFVYLGVQANLIPCTCSFQDSVSQKSRGHFIINRCLFGFKVPDLAVFSQIPDDSARFTYRNSGFRSAGDYSLVSSEVTLAKTESELRLSNLDQWMNDVVRAGRSSPHPEQSTASFATETRNPVAESPRETGSPRPPRRRNGSGVGDLYTRLLSGLKQKTRDGDAPQETRRPDRDLVDPEAEQRSADDERRLASDRLRRAHSSEACVRILALEESAERSVVEAQQKVRTSPAVEPELSLGCDRDHASYFPGLFSDMVCSLSCSNDVAEIDDFSANNRDWDDGEIEAGEGGVPLTDGLGFLSWHDVHLQVVAPEDSEPAPRRVL